MQDLLSMFSSLVDFTLNKYGLIFTFFPAHEMFCVDNIYYLQQKEHDISVNKKMDTYVMFKSQFY